MFFTCAIGRFDLGAGRADWAHGSAAVLGVRAEQMRLESGALLEDSSGRGLCTKPMTVESVEALGDRQYVHFVGGTVVATAPSQTVRVGEQPRCSFDPQEIHLFEADEAGARIN